MPPGTRPIREKVDLKSFCEKPENKHKRACEGRYPNHIAQNDVPSVSPHNMPKMDDFTAEIWREQDMNGGVRLDTILKNAELFSKHDLIEESGQILDLILSNDLKDAPTYKFGYAKALQQKAFNENLLLEKKVSQGGFEAVLPQLGQIFDAFKRSNEILEGLGQMFLDQHLP